MISRASALRRALIVAFCIVAALVQARGAFAQTPQPEIGTKGFAHTWAFKAAPGPDAIYHLLADNYSLTADNAVVHERRLRLQVNSYVAINRNYGETRVIYDPTVDTLEVLHNRTVLPSGATVTAPENAIVDDLPPAANGNPLWSHLRRKIIVHTALEPGAIIELAYRITTKQEAAPWLELGEAMAAEAPIVERLVTIDVPANLKHAGGVTGPGDTSSWARPKIEVAGNRHQVSWRRTNVPALPDETGAPSRDEALPFVWLSTCDRFETAAAALARRVDATGAVPEGATAAVRKATESETDPELRLLAALESLTKAVTVSSLPPSLQHWQPATLARVWQAGLATPLEAAILEAKALESTGFTARPVLLASNPHRNVQAQPGLVGLDRALVRVKGPDGGWRLYDPAAPSRGGPIEATAARPMLVPGILGQEASAQAAPEAWLRAVTAVAEIAADGKINGKIALETRGAATAHAALLRDAARVGSDTARVLPDGKAKECKLSTLSRQNGALSAVLEAKLADKDKLGLVRLEIGGVPGGIDRELPTLTTAERIAPVLLPAPGRESVAVELTLPKGWKVAALPSAVKLENNVGSVEINASADNGVVKIMRRIELAKRIVEPADAAAVHALVVAWLNRSGRELILRP
jgi:hypothetical protein